VPNVIVAIGAFVLGGIARLYVTSADALSKVYRRWQSNRHPDATS
jgi:hypothetical protein